MKEFINMLANNDFFNSQFFIALSTTGTAVVAYLIYYFTKKSKIKDIANILILDIRRAERLITNYKTHPSILKRDYENLMPENNWDKNKHLFVNSLDSDQLELVNNFFVKCIDIDKQMKPLKKDILETLIKKIGLTKGSIRVSISKIKRHNTALTSNAAAQILVLKYGKSILGKLDEEDRKSLPSTPIIYHETKVVVKKGTRKKEKIEIVCDYATTDAFKKGHIEELQRAYNSKCYTSAVILARKIIENLVIDILKKKFPERIKKNQVLYWIDPEKRHQNFSTILENLYIKRAKFGSAVIAIEQLHNKAKRLKKLSNPKAHSWYHLVKKKDEFDNLEFDTLIDLIKAIEQHLKMRK